jgi:GTPase
MFTDRVKLKLSGGKGGNGVVAWRREKFIRKGGPYGGDGGHGGQIILIADHHIHSLESLRHIRHIKAENGRQGGSAKSRGRNGKTTYIKVPLGTRILRANSRELIIDMTEDGHEYTICRGGKGGKGNACFATPTNRAPNYCTEGKPGSEIEVELELKLIADVGLVGFPNAGKSTLISSVTRNKAKCAPYPFTTLSPNIGKVSYDNYEEVFIADIPGIIKGASENRGLGLDFLRHVERCKALVFVLDASGIDQRTPLDDFLVLREEIGNYRKELLDMPYIVLLNKTDDDNSIEHIKKFKEKRPCPLDLVYETSALCSNGLESVLHKIQELVKQSHNSSLLQLQ